MNINEDRAGTYLPHGLQFWCHFTHARVCQTVTNITWTHTGEKFRENIEILRFYPPDPDPTDLRMLIERPTNV